MSKHLDEAQLAALVAKYAQRVTDPLKLLRAEMHWDPHPFCIGPKHVAYASDNCCGRLGEEAMASAPCYICREPLAKHTYGVAMFVEVTRACENKEAGSVLAAIKAEAEADGVIGFAFPVGFNLIKR